MSTYVISDIHGHYDEYMQMLNLIAFSEKDKLFLAGDYVDRGAQTVEMLRWLETRPDNIIPIKGNHDVEYVGYIRLLQQIDESCELNTDQKSVEDTQILFETLKYMLKMKAGDALKYFDYYGTVEDLIMNKGITFAELIRWADLIDDLEYYKRFSINLKDCIVVHAGFCEEKDLYKSRYSFIEDFYIYAREEALDVGGIRNGMIIFGHTPTIAKDSLYYNDGRVFKYYDKDKDCLFYNIDCGCGYKGSNISENCRLACIRLEDEAIFYV